LSQSNFNTTIVLLKENQTQIYNDVIGSIPKSIDNPHHTKDVTITCIVPALNAVLPRSFMMVGFSSIPTINNRKLIPKFPKDSKLVFPCSKLGKKILISVPARIYQIIIGCLSAFIIPKVTRTVQSTIDNAKNICSDTVIYY
jgi:hypothetical protein